MSKRQQDVASVQMFGINMNDKEEFNNLNRIITPIEMLEMRWEVYHVG